MKSSKVLATAFFGLFLTSSVIPASSLAGNIKEPQPVTIQNPSVPVTIGNTSIPVTIGNTSVPVTIQNTPISTQAAPPQPFQWYGSLYIKDYGVAKFTVPEGKLLVIEHVSGYGSLLGTDAIIQEIGVQTVVNGASAIHHLVPSIQGADTQYRYFGMNHIMRAYADSGTEVLFIAVSSWSGSMSMTVSGYLVDVK